MKLLDPLTLAQLGHLEVRARRLLDGLYSGRHLNRTRGASKEFSEHRPYNPGDDPRSLDWKVFGKTDRLVLKQYDEETSLSGVVILDESASMGFHSKDALPKLEYAKTLAAALGTLLVAQHDAIGFLSTRAFLPPRAHESALDPFYQSLERLQPAGVWSIRDVFGRLGSFLKKRSLIFVLSDLMGDFDVLTSALRALHSQRHDVVVIQILDPSEKEFKFEGTILFEDVETGEKLQTDAEILRPAYLTFFNHLTQSYAQFFKTVGIDFLQLTTDTPFERGLGAYLSWRADHT